MKLHNVEGKVDNYIISSLYIRTTTDGVDLESCQLGASCREERDRVYRTHPRRSAARRTIVRVWGGSCPSGCCQVGMAVQLVGPAPAPHGAVGGRQVSAGYGPATVASAGSRQKVLRGLGGLLAILPPGDAV